MASIPSYPEKQNLLSHASRGNAASVKLEPEPSKYSSKGSWRDGVNTRGSDRGNTSRGKHLRDDLRDDSIGSLRRGRGGSVISTSRCCWKSAGTSLPMFRVSTTLQNMVSSLLLSSQLKEERIFYMNAPTLSQYIVCADCLSRNPPDDDQLVSSSCVCLPNDIVVATTSHSN